MKRAWGRILGLTIALTGTILLSGQLMAIPCPETKTDVRELCPYTKLKKQRCNAKTVEACEQDLDIDIHKGKYSCVANGPDDPLTECLDGLGLSTCSMTCRCAWSLVNGVCESTDMCTPEMSEFKKKYRCPKGS